MDGAAAAVPVRLHAAASRPALATIPGLNLVVGDSLKMRLQNEAARIATGRSESPEGDFNKSLNSLGEEVLLHRLQTRTGLVSPPVIEFSTNPVETSKNTTES